MRAYGTMRKPASRDLVEELLDLDPLALFVPNPAQNVVEDLTGNYTATLMGTAGVVPTELIAGRPGAISLDGSGYVATNADARRNLLLNSRVFSAASSWAGGTRDTATYKIEPASLAYDPAGSANEGASQTVSVDANVTYTFGAWVKGAAGQHLRIAIIPNVTARQDVMWTASGDWEWKTVSVTLGATDTSVSCRVATGNTGTMEDVFWMGGAVLERSATAPSYFDGSGYVNDAGEWVPSEGIECGWLGPAHASASDKGILANGTVRTFVAPIRRASLDATAIVVGSNPADFGMLYTAPNNLVIRTDTDEGESFAGTPAAGETILLAGTIDEPGNVVTARINGVPHASSPQPHSVQYAPRLTLKIGAHGATTAGGFVGLIGPVAVLGRTLT